MATCDVRSSRPVEHSPSSITLALLAVSAALQLLLLDEASAVQEPQLPDEHARMVYRPEILSLRTGERRLYVPLRRKQEAFKSVAEGAVLPPSNCTFEGTVYEQGVSGTGRAVVIACPGDPEVHAIIITYRGEAITVAPSRNRSGTVGVRSEVEERYVVHHVSSKSKLLTSWSKLSTRRRRAISSSGWTIELAVFVDAALSNSSPDKGELPKLLLAMLEQVQLILEHRSLGTPIKLNIVHLEVLNSRDGPDTAGGEIGDYLDNFCMWQCRMRRRNAESGEWDHAILLSGLNLRSGNNDSVVGLAYVGGMCACRFSCSIIQAESFQAALEAAHEIGRNLGMELDGTWNRCDPKSFIMSRGRGPGRTNWSACSRKYLEDFLAFLN